MYSQRNNWSQQPMPQTQGQAQQQQPQQISQYGSIPNVHQQYPRQNLPNKPNNNGQIYGQYYGPGNYGQTNQMPPPQGYLPANNVQHQQIPFNYYPNNAQQYNGGGGNNENWNNYPNSNIENINNNSAMGSMPGGNTNRFESNYQQLNPINTNTNTPLHSRPQSSAMSCRSMSSLSTANMVINDMNSTMNTFVEENRFLKNIA